MKAQQQQLDNLKQHLNESEILIAGCETIITALAGILTRLAISR